MQKSRTGRDRRRPTFLFGQGTTEYVLIIAVFVVGIAIVMMMFREPLGHLVGGMTAMVKGWVSGEASTSEQGSAGVVDSSGGRARGSADTIESRGFHMPGWVWIAVIAAGVGAIAIGGKKMASR